VSGYAFSVGAQRDLNEILDFLEREAGREIALQYSIKFEKAFDRLETRPALGSPRPTLGDHTRAIGVHPYVVFYDFDPNVPVPMVLRILHARRNITAEDLRETD
jgi:plasmid stabilization system protein ParE